MKMPALLQRLLPFPVHLPEEIEALDLASPADLAPDWEALLGDGAFLQALEEAWVVARDMGRGRLLPLGEAASLLGVAPDEPAQWLEPGEAPGARRLGRVWLVPRQALGDLQTTHGE